MKKKRWLLSIVGAVIGFLLKIVTSAQAAHQSDAGKEKLFELSELAFRPCKQRTSECRCDERNEFVDCSALRLKLIPNNLPGSVRYLNLSFNEIRVNENDISQLIALQQLYERLEKLDLSSNFIEALSKKGDGGDVFSNMPNLKQLDLSHNQISQLHEFNFGGVSHLASLDLSHNRIKRIHPESCSRMSSLQSLKLDYNHLTHFPFIISNSLQRLSIRHNSISRPAEASQSEPPLPQLQHLDVSFNEIQNETFLLQNCCPNLLIANFSFNRIANLTYDGLLLSRNLQSLDLSFNSLKNLTFSKFSHSQNVSSLKSYQRYPFLNLTGNSLMTCSCSSLFAFMQFPFLYNNRCPAFSLFSTQSLYEVFNKSATNTYYTTCVGTSISQVLIKNIPLILAICIPIIFLSGIFCFLALLRKRQRSKNKSKEANINLHNHRHISQLPPFVDDTTVYSEIDSSRHSPNHYRLVYATLNDSEFVVESEPEYEEIENATLKHHPVTVL